VREIADARSRHEGDEKCAAEFSSDNLKGRGNLEDLSIGGRIILKRIVRK
jgi:hypothetical protein